jgi:hypothetical protein
MAQADCSCCGKTLDLSPEKVARLVEDIPLAQGLQADLNILQKRLAVCYGCKDLRGDVLCSHCGCFVLFRARIAKSYCPHPGGDLWLDQNNRLGKNF